MTEVMKGGGAAELEKSDLSNDLNVITAEINAYQRVAGEAIFEIGKRLKHVKENDLVHGEWSKWCEESLNMSVRNAQRYIRVYKRYASNTTHVSHLPLGILNELAPFDDEELEKPREMPDGSTKTLLEMSRREIEEFKRLLNAEQAERERLEKENAYLVSKSKKHPEVKKEYIKVKDDVAEQKLKRYEELFGDISMYDGKTTRVTNGDAITYTVFEFSEDVRKFIQKYGHLTHFAREFNEMISEGKEEYEKSIGDMLRFLRMLNRNLNEKESVITNL